METKPDSLEMDANCSTIEAKKSRNGVGICVRNHQYKMLEVCRTSDRVIAVKILLSHNVWTIVSAYAPPEPWSIPLRNWNLLPIPIQELELNQNCHHWNWN